MPANTPELESVTPLGRASLVLKVGVGKPVAVKVVEGVLAPITKAGNGPVLMITGASFMVRVKLWSVKPVVFVARTVKV